MKRYNFSNDYSEGCHPSILELLIASNHIQQTGYGDDEYTLNAVHIIQKLCDDSTASVHLIAGGTLTNLTVLASIMKPFESIIAASTGHINTHEAGAIEATGHKIETVYDSNGKLSPKLISPLLAKFPKYHTVKPKVVYISNSTELGTIYTKSELQDLSNFCKQHNLYLFMDGARLPVALTASTNDLTVKDIAKLADVFYIGGTKCGALAGEAVVITNNRLKEDFQYHQKQRGAMMAKGRLLGIQFFTLLNDNLIFDLARHSNTMADKLAKGIEDLGFEFLTKPVTNQLFPILPNSKIEKLQQKFGFIVWKKIDESHSAIRLITSWSTPEDAIDSFLNELDVLTK